MSRADQYYRQAACLILWLARLFAWAPSLHGQSVGLPRGPLEAKVRTACAECHEARLIVQQRLSKKLWTKEVDKMIEWGAVVDPADRDAFIDYLSLNFPPEKPAEPMPRLAAKKP